MKIKESIFLAGFLAVVIFTANAQQGGFTGPGAEVSTVEQAKTLRDDSPVILRGNILRSLGNEKYLFSDGTGTITIEIERKVWGTLSVDENDRVEISGEIERERRSIEVDVKTIKKMQRL